MRGHVYLWCRLPRCLLEPPGNGPSRWWRAVVVGVVGRSPLRIATGGVTCAGGRVPAHGFAGAWDRRGGRYVLTDGGERPPRPVRTPAFQHTASPVPAGACPATPGVRLGVGAFSFARGCHCVGACAAIALALALSLRLRCACAVSGRSPRVASKATRASVDEVASALARERMRACARVERAPRATDCARPPAPPA